MGQCLSCCLGGNSQDDSVNENTHLLDQQYDTLAQEAKILKQQQQRQQELTGIVNDLLDNLIDVTTFMTGLTPGTPSLGYEEDGESHQFPIFGGDKVKKDIEDEAAGLDEATKRGCEVKEIPDLYISFK